MSHGEHRPRSLRWFHAGPLLFGDWGTSRLYVLGLAFYFTAHASPLYLLAMAVIMAGVAWAYTVVCRCFPDGGGVYTAARRLSPTLAIVGGTLLLCDYIVTAGLSAVEAMHYMDVPRSMTVAVCLFVFAAVGVINWLGARSAGRFALVIAGIAIGVSALLAVLCIPYLPAGFRSMTSGHSTISSPWMRWESLVRIVLALSGIEAVANMTGLMTHPVAKTARRTIWLVLAEVVVLNFIFCVALNAMPEVRGIDAPDYITYERQAGIASDQVPEEVKRYRDTALKVIAGEVGTNAFGVSVGRVVTIGSAIVYGLLLLSAVNTAVMAMVSVLYSMAQDGELPKALKKLNYSGVPVIPLMIAIAAPAAVLLIEADAKALGELYAIGVVGAITINLVSCASNRSLEIGRKERIGLWALSGLMGAIELTIIVAKPNATVFAAVVIAGVIGVRFVTRRHAQHRAAAPLPEPELGWLYELAGRPAAIPPDRPRIMLAARGRGQAEFAVNMARERGAALFAIFVRPLRVLDVQPSSVPRLADDRDAQESLGTVALLARQQGVPFFPIYVTSSEVPTEILDYTVTFGCDTLIVGKSRRTLFSRKVTGDVPAQIAQTLPEGVTMITRSLDGTGDHVHPAR